MFTTWHVFNSHMRWHQAPHLIPAEFTIHLHKQAHMASANLFDVCVCSCYLDSDFLSGMRVCVSVPPCGYATLVWHFLPVLTSDLIPLCLSDLKCHPINYSFLTSSCTLSQAIKTPLTSLPDTHSERAQDGPRRT